MSEKLLPCPLCGGCPVLTEAMTEHWVSCGTCGASGGMHGRLKLAVEAWNRRTPAPEGEVVCSGCEGHPVFPNVPCAVCGASPVVPAPDGAACPTCNGVRPEFCSNAFHLASPVVPAPEGEAWTARHIVFDGPPDHNGPRFIEVETPEGKSVNAGEWRQRPDNLWELVIASPVVPVGVSEADINELRVVCDTNQAATDDSRIVRADDLPIGVIRRILAALRPTDTGANHD